jgi:hypothetical protein
VGDARGSSVPRDDGDAIRDVVEGHPDVTDGDRNREV